MTTNFVPNTNLAKLRKPSVIHAAKHHKGFLTKNFLYRNTFNQTVYYNYKLYPT